MKTAARATITSAPAPRASQTLARPELRFCLLDSTALHDLKEIANVEHLVPRDWISEDGFLPNEKLVEYARPLIEGEIKVPTEGGLPKYIALERSPVEKKLPPRA